MHNFLIYILNNGKIISVREFIIIIVFYLVLIANYNNNRLLKNESYRTLYIIVSVFLTLMLIGYLLQLQIAFIMLLIGLIAVVVWLIYNLKMMSNGFNFDEVRKTFGK